jgi:hypothetical protein
MFGNITSWFDLKGFGFITVSQHQAGGISQQQFFFHISNFKGVRPVVGAYVTFETGEAAKAGKALQAVGVRFATAEQIAAVAETGVGTGVASLAKASM